MKIAEYLKKSSSRLSMLWGLIGSILCSFAAVIAWIFASVEPNVWIAVICAIPAAFGCAPYILTKKGKVQEIADAVKKN